MDTICINAVICLFLIPVRFTTSLEIDLVRYNQKTLTAGIYQSLQARSLLQCSALCTIDPSCNSGDYYAGTAECRFSHIVGPSLIASMIGDTNFDAFAKIDCGEPSVEPNSYLDTGSTTAGSQRQFNCDINYAPSLTSDVSSMVVTCQSSGIWTSTDFQCVSDCGEPASKANAALSSGGNLEGDTRTYSCQAGYEAAAGSDTGDVTCQSNGAWSTSTLTCEVDCDLPACGCEEPDDYLLGCYGDGPARALSHRKVLPAMTPAVCLNYCIDNGYAYAAVQAGYECFCGSAIDNYARYGVTTGCDYTCSGDGNQLCGGHYANLVYRTC